MRRRPTLALLGLTVASVALTACTGGSDPAEVATAPVVAPASELPVAPSEVASEAPSPSVSASPSEVPTPSASASPAAPRPAYDVAAAQRVLTDGGYYAGALDGRAGPALRSAVMAFQKVNGLGADGTVGPATLKALAAPKAPVLKGSSPANRVEVDLTKQVLYVVRGAEVARVMPVSSGNGARYAQKDGSTARALTPVGWYTIQRRIVGERNADLGTLYDPQYFYRGWAIHGSNSVPAGPASHGCVRVTRPDAKYLLDLLSNGMTVYLYGGTHVFEAGSSAPGTSNPTGDTPSDTAPARSASPSKAPSPAPTRAPSPSTAPSGKPVPTPSPTAPAPSSSAAPASPSASPSRR
ncbi:MAG: heavy metal translocating P-type ATPase [Frankiales bacterium]|nr:heavy metal translocating P-type ATPase [Frankiales bacterium]